MSSDISFDFSSLTRSIRMLAGMRDGALPQPSEVTVALGTQVGVAEPFYDRVGEVAEALSVIVTTVRAELAKSQEVIRATLEDMVEADASLADEARVVLAALNDIIGSSLPPEVTNPAQAEAPIAAPSAISRTW